MSGFLDRGQLVGYTFATKELVVTVSDKTALKMRADGWDVKYEDELGHFVVIKMEE